ncbi:DUF4097 domain-containing protein [candidate division KSB1 bacterium]
MVQYRKISALIIFCLLITGVTAGQSVLAQSERYNFILDGSLQKNYPLERDGYFSVENINGDIEIESWDRQEVEIEIDERRRGDYELEFEFNVRSDRIEISAKKPRRVNSRRSPSAFITVKVPNNLELAAETTNGSVRVENINGPVEAGTTNGSVIVSNVMGDVDAHTTNGKVELENITGHVRARSTNQSIYLEEIKGSRIDASTTNGGIRADIEVDDNGKYDFSTTNGSIRVTIPENSNADVEAHCRPGSFHSDFDILVRGSRARQNAFNWTSRTIRGTINDGGASIDMKTTNGSVDLRAR